MIEDLLKPEMTELVFDSELNKIGMENKIRGQICNNKIFLSIGYSATHCAEREKSGNEQKTELND